MRSSYVTTKMLLHTYLLSSLLAPIPFAFAANSSATAEIDLLWPLPGETFSLNSKGMATVFALQNRAEAEKHGWNFQWNMCTPRTDVADRQECAFYENNYDSRLDANDKNAPTVLQTAEDDDDLHIEMNHSFWYSDGTSLFNSSVSGVYQFKWQFVIGPVCSRNGSESQYELSKWAAYGAFDVTVNATSAPLPTMTAATCATFLGAVSYTNTVTDWTFQQSVDNAPTCVGLASVTQTPQPCRATLNAEHIGSVRKAMGWEQASTTAAPTVNAVASPSTNDAASVKAGSVAVWLLCVIVTFLSV
jgi:hypothetical protein